MYTTRISCNFVFMPNCQLCLCLIARSRVHKATSRVHNLLQLRATCRRRQCKHQEYGARARLSNEQSRSNEHGSELHLALAVDHVEREPDEAQCENALRHRPADHVLRVQREQVVAPKQVRLPAPKTSTRRNASQRKVEEVFQLCAYVGIGGGGDSPPLRPGPGKKTIPPHPLGRGRQAMEEG